jgi:HEAT repeat protein
MDALALADPAAAEPLVLQALGGDGDPSDWSDERLHAAGIRIRAGKADGAETVKAFLKSGEDLDFVAGETARAASWLPPADGGPVVRRLLALKLEDYDEDDLVAILQAAAALGVGATAERLRPLAAAGPDGALEASVRGAAAGALLRLGDGTGKEVLKDLDETDAADVARGLGARGNEAAFPLLEELLRSEDGDTRAGAARGIADVGGPRAMDGLRRALKDPEEDVRAWAAVGLANLGARDGVAEVRKAAAGKDVWLAIAAWKALAVVGDAESRDAAAKVLAGEVKRVPPLDRHTELMLRVWAAAVIVRTGK